MDFYYKNYKKVIINTNSFFPRLDMPTGRMGRALMRPVSQIRIAFEYQQARGFPLYSA